MRQLTLLNTACLSSAKTLVNTPHLDGSLHKNLPSPKTPVILHTHPLQKNLPSPKSPIRSEGCLKSFDEKYKLEKMIGKGGNANVFAAVRKSDGKKVAVKPIDRRKIVQQRLIKDKRYGVIPIEAYILINCPHENIIEFQDLYTTSTYYILVMELLGEDTKKSKSMDLFALLERHVITEKAAYHIVKQVISALLFLLNEHGVLHGDIKDENILVSWEGSGRTPKVKLIDFGGALFVKSRHFPRTDYFLGTSEFAPPELVSGVSFDGEKAQSWSIGILLYDVLHRRIPFKTSREIIYSKPDLSGRNDLSYLYLDLLSKLLEKNPSLRLSFNELCMHPWFNQ